MESIGDLLRLVLVLAAVLAPAIVAYRRKHHQRYAIGFLSVVNLFVATSYILVGGALWIGLLAWALTAIRDEPEKEKAS